MFDFLNKTDLKNEFFRQTNRKQIVIAILKIITLVASIYCTKFINTEYGFPNIALTSFQLMTIFLFLLIGVLLGLVEIKKIPFKYVLVSSFLLASSAALSNLSIDYNSLKTHQLLKFANVPFCIYFMKSSYAKITIVN